MLRRRWRSLRQSLPFLPRLEELTVKQEFVDLEVVEFVRVHPTDEEVLVAEAPPEVARWPVTDYPHWSEAEADQQAMWSLVGTVIGGSLTTHLCPDCDGSKSVTCSRCRGRRRVDCTWCHGSGYTSSGDERERCSSCWGSGTETCGRCRGSGEESCLKCSPKGTVDHYIRRRFVESTVITQVLPVSLRGYPEPITLSTDQTTMGARLGGTPFDIVTDRATLDERGVKKYPARLFFIRQATVNLHLISDPNSGRLAASLIEGDAPLFT